MRHVTEKLRWQGRCEAQIRDGEDAAAALLGHPHVIRHQLVVWEWESSFHDALQCVSELRQCEEGCCVSDWRIVFLCKIGFLK
ncbi:hypothetical protein E2C01_086174 [Portunus trituberculatus]|uniref:Uncharacterized protein n=1 Tax=Portunus trituberculatus TaxID=210409 RepID=A0A5B7J8Z1_PORTR|nr:hypothetical protein [Portunus trituberculatus]